MNPKPRVRLGAETATVIGWSLREYKSAFTPWKLQFLSLLLSQIRCDPVRVFCLLFLFVLVYFLLPDCVFFIPDGSCLVGAALSLSYGCVNKLHVVMAWCIHRNQPLNLRVPLRADVCGRIPPTGRRGSLIWPDPCMGSRIRL